MTTLSMYRSPDLAARIATLMEHEASSPADRLCDPEPWPAEVVCRFAVTVEQSPDAPTLSVNLHTESDYALPNEQQASDRGANAVNFSPGSGRRGMDGPGHGRDRAATKPHQGGETK